MNQPAYTRLQVDERRRRLIDVGNSLFAEHAFEEISMRQIAEAAGISKSLLYHYFPSKIDLFKAAVQEHAEELQRLIEPSGGSAPVQELSDKLDGYLAWVQANARTWSKLMQSANTLPEARTIVDQFRARTLHEMLGRLTDSGEPRPALRIAVQGWLGYIDAAILDWIERDDLEREQLRDLLIATFASALVAAQQVDPAIKLELGLG